MLALRRAAAHPLRTQGYRLGASRAGYAKSDILSDDLQHLVISRFYTKFISGTCHQPLKRFEYNLSSYAKLSLGRSLSSQVGANSSGEDEDLEDGFSELETPPISETVEGNNEGEANDDELISEPDLSDDDDEVEENIAEDPQNDIDLASIETDKVDEDSSKRRVHSELSRIIMTAPRHSLNSTLDKWVEGGNTMGRSDISYAMLNLRKRRMYGKALQFSEWLEANKRLSFVERDYASRLDLIAKEHGLYKAEKYVAQIPESFRGEVIYRTLLANCVVASNLSKAEGIFNKMRDLELPLTAFACNQLLVLYKRLDKKKIADILLMMEKENIKPTLFTYKLLIDTKGFSNDITGMEQLVETMKAEGFEPDFRTQAMLARHYIHAGFKEKAEAILKEMEGNNPKENRGACRALLPLYAGLGKVDEVERIWKVCESNPRVDESLAAIEAWGKVGRIEDAEAVFEKMIKASNKPSSRCYTSLLSVYANHKLLTKGKDLAKRMMVAGGDGFRVDAYTWDAIVKLYVDAGEVEKADSILYKATEQQKNMKMTPMFSSYMYIMEQYARRGDIHNAEKMFHRLRQAGYVGRLRTYATLLRTYINAKAPAYGFRERMKVDNIFPNKAVAAQLAQVDAFKKTAVSDLLD